MAKPTIIGNASGSVMPNPAYYGFEWPELQAVLDRGQALWDKRGEMGRERQALGEEKKRLEADLVKAEAGAALTSVGLCNKGDLDSAIMGARQDGRLASEIEAANAGDRAEAQDLEARLQAIRARIQSREQLGQLLGMHAGAFVA